MIPVHATEKDSVYLITGFEAFGDHDVNPSYHGLVKARKGSLLPDNVTIAEIPVVWDSAFETLQQHVERTQPDAVLMLGVHPFNDDPPAFRIETTARNRDGEGQDNQGVKGSNAPIVPAAEDRLSTRIDVPRMTRALTNAGFHTQPSDDAGQYLCNHLFFRCVYRYDFACGFVHVPSLKLLSLSEHARAFGALAHALVND